MNTDSLILVVDDELLILSATTRLLKQAGYKVIEAQTGKQALQSAQEYSPDLVLLDNVLPDIDGLEICRRLKADKKTSNIYICIVSGLKITSKDQSEGLEIGADEYLIRPIENRELLARVNAMLRVIRAEKELEKHRNHLKELVEQRTAELRQEIAEHKLTEQQLRKSEGKYRFLTESMADIVWTTDLDFKTTYVSPSVEKILGFTPEERCKQRAEEMLTPDSLHRSQERLLELFQMKEEGILNEEFITIDVEYYTKDGTTVWMECSVKFIHNFEDEVIGLLGVSRDITERKRAEQALKEQRKTLNDILEYAADGICVCHNISIDPFVKFTHWNPRMTEITGYSIEEINHLGWYQSMYPNPEVQQKAVERMASMRLGDDIISEEWAITTKNKTQKILSISTSVIKKENDETHIMAIMQDISERRHYQDQLIASQKEWEDIFQAIGQPTIILDPHHGIIKANKSALNITGLSEKQLTGRKCFDIFHTTVRPPDSCPMEALLHKGSLETVEMVMEALGGTFLVSCTPIIDTNGNLEKIIHIATDITETKRLESQLRQALKMESIGTLTGGIAHDFNNIMGIILGNAELALEDVPKWNPGHTNLEEIKKASLRAANIVRQLLSFTRITDQKLQPMEITLVIKDALKFLRSTIPTTIDIVQEICVTDETILADPTQINQIMMNLCINASHAMEQTGGKLTITVENVLLDDSSAKDYTDLKNGKYVKLMVSDTGPGIDSKIIDRIFDPYFTTKGVGKGSGMGLAVVHGIVKSHSGSIKVDSTLGKGTKFSILFPLTQGKTAVEKETIQEIPRGSETILFVDDEISIVNMVQRMFERLGYKVQTAITPQDALDRFALNPDHFDLVITDMTMPQMTGVNLSEKLMDIRPDIPIIICTGYSALVDEEKAKELGLAAYVMKPINLSEIAQTIRKVLDRK